MNRRSFMGLLGIAPVALKAAPTALQKYTEAGRIIESMGDPAITGLVTTDVGLTLRFIRHWDEKESAHISRMDVLWGMKPPHITYLDYDSVQVIA